MKESQIQSLLNDLFKKKFTKTYSHSSDSYNTFAIDEQARVMVEDLIRNHLKAINDEKIGILEAKVFVYENIISKSNFAPMLENINPCSVDTTIEK